MYLEVYHNILRGFIIQDIVEKEAKIWIFFRQGGFKRKQKRER